jgi:hypothetical protein
MASPQMVSPATTVCVVMMPALVVVVVVVVVGVVVVVVVDVVDSLQPIMVTIDNNKTKSTNIFLYIKYLNFYPMVMTVSIALEKFPA